MDAIHLIDDDTWRRVTIDARLVRNIHADVQLLQMFRFYTHRNGKAGDTFWFDDVRILPENTPKDSLPANSPDKKTGAKP